MFLKCVNATSQNKWKPKKKKQKNRPKRRHHSIGYRISEFSKIVYVFLWEKNHKIETQTIRRKSKQEKISYRTTNKNIYSYIDFRKSQFRLPESLRNRRNEWIYFRIYNRNVNFITILVTLFHYRFVDIFILVCFPLNDVFAFTKTKTTNIASSTVLHCFPFYQFSRMKQIHICIGFTTKMEMEMVIFVSECMQNPGDLNRMVWHGMHVNCCI